MRFSNIIRKIKYRFYTIYLIRKHALSVGNKSYFLGKADIDCRNSIIVGKNCIFSPWVVLRDWGGYILIGDNCTVNSFCHINGNGGVEIGNNVRIATQCVILSANHNFADIDIPICMQGETKEKTVIEDDCWLGAGVKVLAGVHIGKGAVIGAGAVVTHDIEPFSVVVGVPAKVIKKRGQKK